MSKLTQFIFDTLNHGKQVQYVVSDEYINNITSNTAESIIEDIETYFNLKDKSYDTISIDAKLLRKFLDYLKKVYVLDLKKEKENE